MLRYIAKRIFLMIPVLLGISFVIFLLMYFTPGDPAQMILGDLATKEEVEALREEMGLNDGFFERYFRYMGDLLKGDLGTSYTTKVPVWDEISARLPVTAKVAFFVIIFAVLIGVPIGILSAVRQYTIIDSITRVMALLGITMPSFWFALLLVLLFSVKLGWLPASGLYGPAYYVLPIISISAASVAIITRTARSSMLEVIRQDYIDTARFNSNSHRCGNPVRRQLRRRSCKRTGLCNPRHRKADGGCHQSEELSSRYGFRAGSFPPAKLGKPLY